MTKYYLILLSVFFIVACKKTDVAPSTNPTPPPPNPEIKTPKLVTNNATSLTMFSVTLTGQVIDTGGAKVSELGIVVDTVSNPTITKNFNKFLVQQPNSNGTITFNVTHLPSNTTFYIRAFATNSFGTGYGNEIKFTTFTQKIFTGDVNLSSQQQVIDFGAKHYTTIDGSLYISGPITDLSPLLGLSIINNAFNATYTLLTNFKGLDSLEVTGAISPNGFYVERNKDIINFSGLSKLKYTRGPVQINFNNSLINLDGLDSYYAASAGGFRIDDCPKLQNINGLRKLSFVGNDVFLRNNQSLADISGLSNLSTISGRLYIINNASLQNLTGLEKIQSLPDGFEINNNASLYDLSGLRNLKSINGPIQSILIKDNPKITDLSAFTQITAVGGITIENNASLKNLTGLKNLQTLFGLTIINDSSLISLTGLENLVQVDGSIQIFNNILLADFCPLKPLFSKGYNKFFSATNNAYNPTQNDVIINCH